MKVKICRGLPGSGKSTFADSLTAKDYIHVENDMYLFQDGKYIWSKDGANEAARQCFNQFKKALRDGKNVVVSNIFVTRKAVDMYADAAKAYGADIEVIRFTGNFGNKHNVPPAVYASMAQAFQDYPDEKIFDYEKNEVR